MTIDEAIESFKCSNKQAKIRLKVEKMRMDIGEIKELEFYIERDEMAITALEREQKFLDAGYKNGRVEFMIGGRKFMVKEMAQ